MDNGGLGSQFAGNTSFRSAHWTSHACFDALSSEHAQYRILSQRARHMNGG